MKHNIVDSKPPYQMEFDPATIKHLGFQMYSTLPQVIGELVANAWDANATEVKIKIPDTRVDEKTSEIVIIDNGIGMSDADVRDKYLRIGRDRREKGQDGDITSSPLNRKVMGRKGIGKFSGFGIAKEIVVESVKGKETSHFRMNYEELIAEKENRSIEFDPLSPTGDVQQGTKITLKYITIYHTRPIDIDNIRQGLARRFAVIGAQYDFEVIINDKPISIEERDLKSKLAVDLDGKPYIWEYDEVEIEEKTELKVSGWIGALDKTSEKNDQVGRGIVLMARGKLVQDPFHFDAVIGQQFALSYLIGELHVDFVDDKEKDTIATARNSLVWDAEPNKILKEWGKVEVNRIASLWAKRRKKDNKRKLQQHPLYLEFQKQAEEIDKKLEFERADRLIQQLILQSIEKNPDANIEDFESMVDMFIKFWQFDSFQDMAKKIGDSGIEELEKILDLFGRWEVLEAKEMMKVTEGRIMAIKKLQRFIDTNAKEVPTLHKFLKQFPWVLDPHWTLVADELRYSDLLRNTFPESNEIPEVDRRIDFLCVSEGTHLVVVEIKRPKSKASVKELNQIEQYVSFMRDQIKKTTDPRYRYSAVTGYLLCDDLVDHYLAREKRDNLAEAGIYVKRYGDLLKMVEDLHTEILERYNQLPKVKQITESRSHS